MEAQGGRTLGSSDDFIFKTTCFNNADYILFLVNFTQLKELKFVLDFFDKVVGHLCMFFLGQKPFSFGQCPMSYCILTTAPSVKYLSEVFNAFSMFLLFLKKSNLYT